jgi:hypothetical protein
MRTPWLEDAAAALAVYKAIRDKAADLLPSARSLATSRSTWASFTLHLFTVAFIRRLLGRLLRGGQSQHNKSINNHWLYPLCAEVL